MDRMVGVLGIAWRYGRCCHGRYMAARKTVYWGYKGTHGSIGIRMVGVPGMRGGTRVQYGGSITGSLGGTGVFP